MSDRSIRCLLVSACVLGGVFACGGVARATPDFPAVVVQELMLPGITIDPPNGCTLCHTTDQGGTSVKPFGQLMEEDGVMAYDEASLRQALTEVETDDPKLIADIKAGIDPSADVSGLPTPEYGCSAAGACPGPGAWALLAPALALVFLGRRRRV